MRSICSIFFFFLLSFQLFANTGVTPVISEVTVYRSGAKLSSVATVKIPAGKSEVIFENLSPYFNANSLQVKIKGSATLLSAVFSLKTPGAGPEHPRAPVLRDSLLLLGDEFSRIRDEREVLNGEKALIDSKMGQIGLTTTDPNTRTTLTVAELRELTTFYRQQLLDIKDRLLQIAIKERTVNETYKNMQADLQRLQPNTANQTGEVVMKIDAASAQSVEITCTYLVTQAGWTPLYDLRSDGLDKPLQLVYKANVSNLSGFDWKGVVLHLSTASPLSNNDRPILNPVFVDFRPVVAYYQKQDINAPMANVYQMEQVQIDGGAVNMRGSRGAETEFMLDSKRAGGALPAADDLSVLNAMFENTGDFNVTFDVAKPQDILADGKENIIQVDEKDMPATYEYHSVPKLEPTVFLLAKLADYGKYNLLPGRANLFFQDTYIGQAFINPQVAADTLLLSLGRDEQITIKRVQPQDFTERKKIFGSTIKETYTYEIAIKNNKSIPVTVDLLDQIPVSKQKEIVVEIEETGGSKYNADFGKLEWQVAVPAGQTKKVRFTYSIKRPKDKAVGMVRQ
ncbi:MAG: DUF4139 domain-containing protein [Lewinellaceae bacterium]|nr:DUF4139 domain-containing protein [Lewinellaceae bacterium]